MVSKGTNPFRPTIVLQKGTLKKGASWPFLTCICPLLCSGSPRNAPPPSWNQTPGVSSSCLTPRGSCPARQVMLLPSLGPRKIFPLLIERGFPGMLRALGYLAELQGQLWGLSAGPHSRKLAGSWGQVGARGCFLVGTGPPFIYPLFP